MRVVNLARRPFINRRPIFRFAALLWVAAAALLALNIRLYSSHWLGSADNRARLEEVEGELAEQTRLLDQQAAQLARTDLREQNRRSAFLNSLISYRTFPWSALFEDLEDVLPPGVKVYNVQPVVRLAEEVARARRLAERRASLRARRSGDRARSSVRGTTSGESASEEPSSEESSVAAQQQLAADEVGLRLNGFAESQDAVIELVERLFENPAFRRPVLDSEIIDRSQGPEATSFTASVVYLTRRPELPPRVEKAGAPAAGTPAEDALSGEADPAGVIPGEGLVEGIAQVLAEGMQSPAGPSPGAPSSATGSPSGRSRPGAPPPGDVRAGLPRAGTPGVPPLGTTQPDPARPRTIMPRGRPTSTGAPSAGAPSAGTLSSGMAAGAPASADRGAGDDGMPGRDRPEDGVQSADDGADERPESPMEPEPETEDPDFGDRDASDPPGLRSDGRLFSRLEEPATPTSIRSTTFSEGALI